MAGSGRGRGHASFAFNMEALGFGKGAALPHVICKLPPPFPSTNNKPVPLKIREDEDYMLALKQDLRETMKKMPYFLTVGDEHQRFLRNSQKYQDNAKEQETLTPDWRRLPREMKPKKANKKAFSCRIVILEKQLVVVVLTEKQIFITQYHLFFKENDYISSYFEDGDGFGVVSDDNMVEGT
ncbi:DNA-directed RNA polymerase III subunit RPC7 [Vidua macroura]|uniref:DNA-directed RNA polymerase III subunit RPC7 n=1 Tax=Vidua macroura TaxID=187451 RepID=UPI0023A908FB|nr:DNA-directed RNA polymerase III subunit RPC7 [Vidua macroura]